MIKNIIRCSKYTQQMFLQTGAANILHCQELSLRASLQITESKIHLMQKVRSLSLLWVSNFFRKNVRKWSFIAVINEICSIFPRNFVIFSGHRTKSKSSNRRGQMPHSRRLLKRKWSGRIGVAERFVGAEIYGKNSRWHKKRHGLETLNINEYTWN